MRKVIIALLVGCIIGFILCFIYVTGMSSLCSVDWNKQYGMPEIVYYLSQPIGVLLTFLAVVVAIFGTNIRNRIFSPKCVVSVLEDGVTENQGETVGDANPVVKQYECTLQLENCGNKEIKDLELVLKEVHYAADKKSFKKINVNEAVIFWTHVNNKKIHLREKEKRGIVLARILPKDSSGTPDGTQTSPLRFSLIGVNSKNHLKGKNGSGAWKVKYSVRTPQSILKTFTITYSWTGKWCNRINEMTNETGVTLEEEKI